MDLTLDLLSWRAYLANARELPRADVVLRMASRHATQAGDGAVALARAVAEIVEGFSPQWKHIRGWPVESGEPVQFAGSRPGQRHDAMTLALEELRAFARRFAGQLAGERPQVASDPHQLHQMTKRRRASRAHRQGVTADIHALHALLADKDIVTGGAGEGEGAAILARLDNWCSGLGRLDAPGLAAAPLPDQICALAVFNLRSFLRETADLGVEPTGSIAMLQAAARFDSFGLGPYLRNVGTLVRHSLDMFEMAHVAASGSARMGHDVPVELWVALLARALPGPLLCEVVDDLGDIDARAGLAVVLARVASNRDATNIDMVMRLRDIALDNLDYETAASAQRRVCDLRPGNVLELTILASIHASLGNTNAARQMLEEALRQEPGNENLKERISALREYRFEPFLILHGFGSPEDRLHTRLTRRSTRLHTARAATDHAVGVEFTS